MRKFSLLLILLVIAQTRFASAAATCTNYSVNPPFALTAVKPNVDIVMDFSGSMQFPSYIPCSFTGYNSSKVGQCGSSTSGGNYDASIRYYGYFSDSAYYNVSGGKFQINTACSNTDYIGSSGCISGRLLNWVTTTRVDVLRKILTGGRILSTTTDTYLSEGADFTYTDSNLKCIFDIIATTTTNRTLTIKNQSSTQICKIGTLAATSIYIKENNPSSIKGLTQDFYNLMDMEFTVFNSDYPGVMRTGKNVALSTLVSSINGEFPYNGTPTGEALWEAYDFFKQSNDHNYASNTAMISPANPAQDPYYDSTTSGTISVKCRKSFALLLSDGAWNGNVDPVVPALSMHNNDLRSTLADPQNVYTYVVFAFGDKDPIIAAQGRSALITTAIFGGFTDKDANSYPYPFTSINGGLSTDCGSTYDNSQRSDIKDNAGNTYCNSRAISYPLTTKCPIGGTDLNCLEWVKVDATGKQTGLPYNFFEADDGFALKIAIADAFNDIVSKIASGTAASILSNSEGSGANILQAMFFPRKMFENGTTADWTGELHNLWYYLDPKFNNSTVREDTDYTSADRTANNPHKLELTKDRVVKFYYDPDPKVRQTLADLFWDTDGDGSGDVLDKGRAQPDEVNSLWRAGKLLWERDLTKKPRTIYTTTNGSNLTSFAKSSVSPHPLLSLLQASSDSVANNIIDYVHGKDVSIDGVTTSRNRTVDVKDDSGTIKTAVWKLGDIIDSTPRLQSTFALNYYHQVPPQGYNDDTYSKFINSSDYKNRGLAYAGANDGMLHAFKLGKLNITPAGGLKATLSGTNLGEEQWAFIPKNALPYLSCYADPANCHLYFVDGSTSLVDASIANPSGCSSSNYEDCVKDISSWRTVLLGGMGLGGASRDSAGTCNSSTTDCVKSPMTGNGYSSYFALDVTQNFDSSGNMVPPKLMWEFSHPELGYATTGVVVMRISARTSGIPDNTKNGKWFAVFASGPTGPIDTVGRQFLGRSDQELKIFVVDLNAKPPFVLGTNYWVIPTGKQFAFAGSINGGQVDTDRPDSKSPGFYQDDALYIGYTQRTGSGTTSSPYTWTDGGVLRLMTGKAGGTDGPEVLNPANWSVSTVIQGIGPVSARVAKLQDMKNHELWLYFGTGRYFYGADDNSGLRTLFGVKEPCYKSVVNHTNGTTTKDDLDEACTTTIQKSDLTSQTTLQAMPASSKGWYIDLDAADPSSFSVDSRYGAERVVTDPVALTNGVVYFTTFKPITDICSAGGNSFMWQLKYNSGQAPDPASLKGKILIQVSTGSFEEKDLQTAFGAKDNRRTTDAMSGKPPNDAPLPITNADMKPVKKIIHIRER